MPMQSPHVGCWGMSGPDPGRCPTSENDPLRTSVEKDGILPSEFWRTVSRGIQIGVGSSRTSAFPSSELFSNALIADLRPKRAEPRSVRPITYVLTWLCDTGACPPDEWIIQSKGESDE